MRTCAILFSTALAALFISLTACENLFYDANDQFNPTEIYMFTLSTTHDGNLGGRIGADALCQAEYDARYSHLEAYHVRAFINMSDSDEIRDMPENYGVPTDLPIVGPTGKVIDNNWAALLDGSIQQSLYNAGLFSSATQYWTGEATGNGTLDASAYCSGWTTNSGAVAGIIGNSGFYLDQQWIRTGTGSGCSMTTYTILCIAW